MHRLGLGLVTSQALANTNKLWLNVLNIHSTNVRPNVAIKERVGLVPGPVSSRKRSGSGEVGSGTIAFGSVGLNKLITRLQIFVVYLQAIGASDLVVGTKLLAGLVHVRANRLVIMRTRKSLVLGKLRLSVLLPLSHSVRSRLFGPRSSILDSIRTSRLPDLAINGVVVGAGDLDVWRCVIIVVGLDMRLHTVLELEVWLAD